MTWLRSSKIEPLKQQAMNLSESDWLSMLRPSAVSGLVRLRRRLTEAPHLTPEEARKLLLASYNSAGLDFESAIRLHEVLPVNISEPRAIFQATITLVAGRCSPPWTALLRRGRGALEVLDPDTVACFDRAGAFAQIPDADVLRWWDELASQAYADRDLARCAIGREAERRSLVYERRRLQELPDAPAPVWKALDNNLVGYDIQSWLEGPNALLPKLVEVKGSTRMPMTFHVSRNEWETAVRNPLTYFFQVWHLDTDQMVELSVCAVRAHMPLDQGRGQWQEALVELPLQ